MSLSRRRRGERRGRGGNTRNPGWRRLGKSVPATIQNQHSAVAMVTASPPPRGPLIIREAAP
ncbi:hypothetical protein EYF80_038921 [Liparis tanakae]|uniref:Uncharacterized protein n=1 Tax=Liparis tanakae TaxID=230148 RepID=A0A4Z2GBA0_9TELE|nr:hypothetical protein EYF80_038921 [Liparis tanakae]